MNQYQIESTKETLSGEYNPLIIQSIDIIHCKTMLTSNNDDEYKDKKTASPSPVSQNAVK